MRHIIFLVPSLWLIACASPLLGAEPTNDQPTTHIRFNTAAEADAKRQQLIDYIWAAGLPTMRLPNVTANVATPNGIDASLVASVDCLDATVSGLGFHSISYLLHPKNTANVGRLAIVQQGHCPAADGLSYGIGDTANRLLQEGYSVIAMNMPLNGWNMDSTFVVNGTAITVPSTGVQGHDDMFQLLCPKYVGDGPMFRSFLEPVVQGINYFESITPATKDVTMIGLSGGGWTTSMAAAIDTRINLSIPVAGSAPLYVRNRIGSAADTEQIYTPLYDERINADGSGGGVATWLEIYALGGYGAERRQIMVTIPGEVVGLFGTTWVTDSIYGATVNGLLTDVMDELHEGQWRYAYDVSSTAHQISPWTIDNVIMPALAVPEPPCFVLAALGLLGLGPYALRMRR